ncbi:MAG: glutamate-1-semialdehyde 2,1-aminomutase [Chitinivibrionales bacterium]|nr:glutamate-1-semialdehyde 2,1-aminomutase [Chitinivibrionales bacterium]
MTNSSLFQDALQVIPGGVDSPVRAFGALGTDPIFIARGSGKHIWSEDDRMYVDFCMSWGALLLGHGFPATIRAVEQALRRGTSFGAPTKLETELAAIIRRNVPSIEKVRFVNSGTEATMTAVRLARGYTNRPKIIKFDGCYHGHSDCLLTKAGSGAANLAEASSAGVPAEIVAHTISLPFNNLELVEQAFAKNAGRIAGVIVEPVPANMGVIVPRQEYLTALRKLTQKEGALLIFDEVITGFRVGLGGAQERFDIAPDLTTLGKVIGGGFPVGALGGRADIMDTLAPTGPVYQAGTLSGNPIAMTAGIASLSHAEQNPQIYSDMEAKISVFAERWRAHSNLSIAHIGSMFTIFCTENNVRHFEDAATQDGQTFKKLHTAWQEQGVYMPPSMFETAFISPLHTDEDLDLLIAGVTSPEME